MANLAVLISACSLWAFVAFLCVKYRWLCPSMFLLAYGYKDWLIGLGYSTSGGITDPVLHVALWTGLAVSLDLRVRSHWRHYDWPSIFCFLLLALWMITTLRWTRAPEYGAYKAFRFASFCGLAYLSGMTVRGEVEYRRMVWCLLCGAIPLGGFLLLAPTISESGRATIYAGGPLNASLALAAPATILFAMASKFPRLSRQIVRASAVILTVAILPTGSRAFFAMPILALLYDQLSRPGTLSLKASRSLAVLLIFACVAATDYDLGRAGRVDIDQTARAEQWRYTFSGAMRSFSGHGCGDFGYAFNGFDARAFPHNFILEAWYELGVPGLLLLLLWWLQPLRLLLKYRASIQTIAKAEFHTAQTLVGVFAVTSFAILPHFDLSDNRALYVTMGLAVGKLTSLRSRVFGTIQRPLRSRFRRTAPSRVGVIRYLRGRSRKTSRSQNVLPCSGAYSRR